MNWAIVIIVISASIFLVREFREIARARRRLLIEAAWPQFEETYISALQSGMSITDGFSFSNDFEIPEISKHVNAMVGKIDQGIPLLDALSKLGSKLQLGFADLFIAIVSIAHQTGGQNLVAALTEHVEGVRFELSARGDIRARQNAILAVAKLGLLAPWILVAVLSVNQQTRESFNSVSGNLLLLGGFAISLLAYRMTVRAGRSYSFKRILGAGLG